MQQSNYSSDGNMIVNNAIARIQENNYHAKSFLLWVSARLWASQTDEIIISFKEVQEASQLSGQTRPNKIVKFIGDIKEKNRIWDIRDYVKSDTFTRFVPIFELIEISNFTRNNFVRMKYSQELSLYLNAKKRYCVLPTKIVLESTPTIQNLAIDLLINRYNGKYILSKEHMINNYGLSALNHLSKLKTKYFNPLMQVLSDELPDIKYEVKYVGGNVFIIFSWSVSAQNEKKKNEINEKINNNKNENSNYGQHSNDDMSDDDLIKFFYGGETNIWK